MSIGTTSRSLKKAAMARFPGAPESALKEFVLLQVGTALEHGSRGTKDEELLAFADIAFNEAIEEGVEWALALKNSVRDSKVKPLVAKARAAGVDPLPVVVVEAGLSADEARAMIESLDAEGDGAEGEPDQFVGNLDAPAIAEDETGDEDDYTAGDMAHAASV